MRAAPNSGAIAVAAALGIAVGIAVRVAVTVGVAIVIIAGVMVVTAILDDATVWVVPGPQDELPQEYRVYEPEVVPWDRIEGEGDFPPICAGRSYRERLAG